MTLLEDYRLTLRGELEFGCPDNLRTRIGSFLWALRRFMKGEN